MKHARFIDRLVVWGCCIFGVGLGLGAVVTEQATAEFTSPGWGKLVCPTSVVVPVGGAKSFTCTGTKPNNSPVSNRSLLFHVSAKREKYIWPTTPQVIPSSGTTYTVTVNVYDYHVDTGNSIEVRVYGNYGTLYTPLVFSNSIAVTVGTTPIVPPPTGGSFSIRIARYMPKGGMWTNFPAGQLRVLHVGDSVEECWGGWTLSSDPDRNDSAVFKLVGDNNNPSGAWRQQGMSPNATGCANWPIGSDLLGKTLNARYIRVIGSDLQGATAGAISSESFRVE